MRNTSEDEKHDYEGNWPYEPCHVCGRTFPGDLDVHNYRIWSADA